MVFPPLVVDKYQWGWNPVGMMYDFNETPNALMVICITNSVQAN
jgi:hypothetical protein